MAKTMMMAYSTSAIPIWARAREPDADDRDDDHDQPERGADADVAPGRADLGVADSLANSCFRPACAV
jgi:hypothetical protein